MRIDEGSGRGAYTPTISMNRPSRGDRESAATTRYVGCFFLPMRIRRSLTATRVLLSFVSGVARLLVEARQGERLTRCGPAATTRGCHPAAALAALAALLAAPYTLGPGQSRHALHQLLHLAELLDQLADVCGLGAAAVGDPQAAGAVDDVGLDPLLACHRADDRLDLAHLVLVDLGVAQLLGDAGHQAHQVLQRAHLPDLLQLVQEVVERELPLEQLGGGGLGLVLLVDLLGLL